jgi:hypothetical protein
LHNSKKSRRNGLQKNNVKKGIAKVYIGVLK